MSFASQLFAGDFYKALGTIKSGAPFTQTKRDYQNILTNIREWRLTWEICISMIWKLSLIWPRRIGIRIIIWMDIASILRRWRVEMELWWVEVRMQRWRCGTSRRRRDGRFKESILIKLIKSCCGITIQHWVVVWIRRLDTSMCEIGEVNKKNPKLWTDTTTASIWWATNPASPSLSA